MMAAVQIVDDNDNPIGEAPLSDVYDKGLSHRVARVMVEDTDGKILIQKRQSNMRSYPSCWDNSAAGHVDAGESYEEAAARELFEEVGIQSHELVAVGDYQIPVEFQGVMLKRFQRVFKVKVPVGTALTLQPDEVADAKWCTHDEVEQLLTEHPDQVTDGLAEVFSRYY